MPRTGAVLVLTSLDPDGYDYLAWQFEAAGEYQRRELAFGAWLVWFTAGLVRIA